MATKHTFVLEHEGFCYKSTTILVPVVSLFTSSNYQSQVTEWHHPDAFINQRVKRTLIRKWPKPLYQSKALGYNHSYDSEFNLHANGISFSYEKMGTKLSLALRKKLAVIQKWPIPHKQLHILYKMQSPEFGTYFLVFHQASHGW